MGDIDQNRCNVSDSSPGEDDAYSVVKFQIWFSLHAKDLTISEI
jgi:hypothetical protein